MTKIKDKQSVLKKIHYFFFDVDKIKKQLGDHSIYQHPTNIQIQNADLYILKIAIKNVLNGVPNTIKQTNLKIQIG